MYFESALLFGTLSEARNAVINNPNSGRFELEQLAKRYGLEDDTAHLLVSAAMQIANRRLVAEVKEKTDQLIFFLEMG